MSIFSKLFGSKREDDDRPENIEDRIPPTTGSSIDRPAEKDIKDIKEPAVMTPAPLQFADDVAKRISEGLSDFASSLKVISENIISHRATAETLSKTSRRQLKVIEGLSERIDRLAEGSTDPALIHDIGDSLKEEVRLISQLGTSLTDTNTKLEDALEKMSVAINAMPDAEARQAEIMETMQKYLTDSADLKKMIYTLAESVQNQSRSITAVADRFKSEIGNIGNKIEGRDKTRNLLLLLVFLAVVVLGLAALLVPALTAPAGNTEKPATTTTP